MQRSPLMQDAAEPSSATQDAFNEALITGPDGLLWAGAGAVLLAMAAIVFLLLRNRLRRAKANAGPREFFQPAGEGAEISFDEDRPGGLRAPAEPSNLAEVVIEPAPAVAAEPPLAAPAPAIASKRKGASPFAGLFARRARDDDEAQLEQPDEQFKEADFAFVWIERPAAAPTEAEPADFTLDREGDGPGLSEGDRQRLAEAARRESEALRLKEAEAEEERRRRLAAAEERRAEERIAAQERERLVRAQSEERVSETGGARLLQKVEEALAAQRQALLAETENLLEALGRRFEARFEALAHRVDRDERRPDRGEFPREAVAALAKRIDEIAASLASPVAHAGDRAMSSLMTSPMAPSVQLGDIVRNALPPDSYEFGAVLSNKRKVDCLIRLPDPPGAIAVDARFPAEAFYALGSGGNDGVETDFRRIALRHIVDIAERLIVPGETAESALMFLSSEAMFTELHARFPDVVQDSYRARVWIVSPTSLMATLHTMRAVLRDAKARESAHFIHTEAQQVLGEVDLLRDRVTALENSFEQARHEVRNLVATTDQVYRRAESISHSGRSLAEEELDLGSRRILRDPDEEPGANNDQQRGDLWNQSDDGSASEDERSEPRPHIEYPLR